MEAVAKPVVFNICMLGAVIGLTHIVRTDSIIKVLEAKIPSGFLEINKKALEIGLKLGEDSPLKSD
jgi:2-oxoglutarate ferredoxin oxidoreductase subunit gamma